MLCVVRCPVLRYAAYYHCVLPLELSWLAQDSGIARGREFHPLTIGIRAWLANHAYLVDERGNITTRSGTGIGDSQMALNRGATVKARIMTLLGGKKVSCG